MKITILGGGSWGTALAVTLFNNGNKVSIWEFNNEQVEIMKSTHKCPLLPNVELDESIFITNDIQESLQDFETVLVVVPSNRVVETIEKVKDKITKDKNVVICSKGFADNAELLSSAVEKLVPANVYCLYGPTHAEEVGFAKFTGIVLAGKDKNPILLDSLKNKNFLVEYTEDIIGVQIGASLKNILAILIGILDGLSLGDNAKAFMMTKGLAEIKEIGVKMGAKTETFYDLSGVGDMIVTCTSQHSRNRYLGEQIRKGKKLDDVISEMKMIAEGVKSTKEAKILIDRLKIKSPIFESTYKILFEEKDPKTLQESFV